MGEGILLPGCGYHFKTGDGGNLPPPAASGRSPPSHDSRRPRAMAITKIMRLIFLGVIQRPVPKPNSPCPVPNSIQIQGSKKTELLQYCITPCDSSRRGGLPNSIEKYRRENGLGSQHRVCAHHDLSPGDHKREQRQSCHFGDLGLGAFGCRCHCVLRSQPKRKSETPRRSSRGACGIAF